MDNSETNNEQVAREIEATTEPCPACHRPNMLTPTESLIQRFVCDLCYAEEEGRSMSEGFGTAF